MWCGSDWLASISPRLLPEGPPWSSLSNRWQRRLVWCSHCIQPLQRTADSQRLCRRSTATAASSHRSLWTAPERTLQDVESWPSWWICMQRETPAQASPQHAYFETVIKHLTWTGNWTWGITTILDHPILPVTSLGAVLRPLDWTGRYKK